MNAGRRFQLGVRLTPYGQQVATKLADAFRSRNLEVSALELGRANSSGYELHLNGIGGEICFCRLFSLIPDLRVGVHDHADATLKDGRTVDVKAMGFPNADLLVLPGKKNKPCDLYAMMVGRFPEYRFAGWAAKDEVFRPDRYRQYPASNWNYVVPKEELVIPWDLLTPVDNVRLLFP